MARRHEFLHQELVTALQHLTDIHDGLPARAQANAWWPYRGRTEYSASASTVSGSPSLAAGEHGAAGDYRLATGHLQRALVAVAACHAGERWRWANPRLESAELPRDLVSPADCSRMASVLRDQLRFLAPAVADEEATNDVLDQLTEAAKQIRLAHQRFTRAAPVAGGRGAARRPTKPARRRGR